MSSKLAVPRRNLQFLVRRPLCRSPSILLPRRNISTDTEPPHSSNIAAPEIDFENFSPNDLPPQTTKFARIVPASPSYFSGRPAFTDDLIALQALLRRFQTLPTLAPSAAPRSTWKRLEEYRLTVREDVQPTRYNKVKQILQRLNRIHPRVMPKLVKAALDDHRSPIDPLANKRKPGVIDADGRAYGTGRRKTAKAQAWVVDGDGEVLVNGGSLNTAFGRIHDRESAVWALKATGRLDKYNVFATVHGGGKTGQAESITLAVSRALMVHEPALKPALRRGKCRN